MSGPTNLALWRLAPDDELARPVPMWVGRVGPRYGPFRKTEGQICATAHSQCARTGGVTAGSKRFGDDSANFDALGARCQQRERFEASAWYSHYRCNPFRVRGSRPPAFPWCHYNRETAPQLPCLRSFCLIRELGRSLRANDALSRTCIVPPG